MGVAVCVQELNSNGNPTSPNTASAAMVVVTSDEEEHRDSSEQHSNSSMRDLSERGRTLSARSHDPLPEVPKLEPAKREGDGIEGDAEDDDPYVEVPVDNQNRMNESDSDDEMDGRGRGGAEAIPLENPPKDSYGKVSRHSKPLSEPKQQHQQWEDEEDDSDSYAEVRDVIRRGPPFAQRDRSKTDPPNPFPLGNTREKRALTETAASASAAHMPLPDIPATSGGIPPAITEENTMYDSIPESDRKASPSSRSSSEIKRKERLYESVDDMGQEEMAGDKDLYESVPDTYTKVDSPVTLNTFSPGLSPTRPQAEMPPMPPRSPIPTGKAAEQQQLGKKEGLKKTLSSAQSEEKRRFSFFNRKKTSSISSGLKKGEQPRSPTALTSSTSPQHKSHSPHNLPIPPPPDEDEEEDTYDKVTITPNLPTGHSDHFQLPPPQLPIDDARLKSMSLPMGFRTGGRPNLPLPKLPEDSGSGTVQHQRLTEGEGGVEYDTLRARERIEDEPNYDTVKVEDILLPSATARSGFDPPYDKINNQEVKALREREMQLRDTVHAVSSEPADASGGYSKVRGEVPGGELDGQRPEHDEEGYAVVPEEIKMRKRAFSASQGMHPPRRDLSPDSVAAGYHVVGHDETLEQQYDTICDTHTQSMLSVSPKKLAGASSPGEDQYASIDMVAKHDKKRQELEEALRIQEELRGYTEDPRGVSPIPPPLPPALHPDHLDEFASPPPPIPAQSQDIHELVEGGEEGLRVPPQSDSGDPPYAKVKSKVDNPYAEVNSSNRPYAEVDIIQTQPPPKSKSSAKTEAAAADGNLLDEALGFGVRVQVLGSSSAEEKPYDTIQDVMTDVKSAPRQIEQNMPKLDTVEESSGNIYNTLLPDGEVYGTDDEEEEEAKYEEIDKIPRSMV